MLHSHHSIYRCRLTGIRVDILYMGIHIRAPLVDCTTALWAPVEVQLYIGICFIPGHSNWCNKEPIVLQVSDGEWWLLGLEVYGGRDWALCACGTTHDCRVCVSIISRWRLKTYLFAVCIGDMTCMAGGTECMLGLCALCVWYGLITIVPGTSPRRGLGGQAPLLREVPPSPRGENSAVYCKV